MTIPPTAPGSPDLSASAMMAVRNAPFALIECTVDLDDLVIAGWNGEAERIFGYPGDEVVGRRLADTLLREADGQAWRRAWRRAARGRTEVDRPR